MKIQAEFEDILRGVELTEREKRFLRWITSWDDHTMQNMRTVVEKVRSTLSTLQAENETLRAELKSKVDLVFQQAKELDRRHLLLQEQEAELEQVKRERDMDIKRLREIDWCAGCKDFCGLDGCAGVGMENCTAENDHYQFGPKEG